MCVCVLFVLPELERAGEWTESHINDYCGFFHRQVIWNQMLTTFDPTTQPQRKRNKGETYALVHATLPLQLRHWSKKFPTHELVAAASAPAPSLASAVAATAAAPASSAPSSSSASIPGLHLALASCSFCSLFSSLEWSHLNDLQLKYPGHESLWMYRRFVWHAFIAAIQQHAVAAAAAAAVAEPPVATSTAPSAPAAAAAAGPSIPSWLLPLVHRELEYADFQVADVELSNYAANRTFALLYKVWVMHSALTIVYQQHMHAAAAPAAVNAATDATFPLFQHLSPPHRTWYLSMLHAVNRIQPDLMQRHHWQERTRALASAS